MDTGAVQKAEQVRPLTMARICRDPVLRSVAEALVRAEIALHWAARGELSQDETRAAHADARQALALVPTALVIPPTRAPKG